MRGICTVCFLTLLSIMSIMAGQQSMGEVVYAKELWAMLTFFLVMHFLLMVAPRRTSG